MPQKMDYDEYSKYIPVVLERIAEKKKAKEAAEARLPPQDSEKDYTLDDVVDAVSIASPEDRGLTLQVIEEIESRIKPRGLLSSVNDKLQYYDNLNEARNKLAGKKGYFNNWDVENDLLYLATQGVLELGTVNKYLNEAKMLTMVLTDEVPSSITEKHIERAFIGTALTTALGGSTLIGYASSLLLSGGLVALCATIGLGFSVLMGVYMGAKRENAVRRKNIKEAREEIKEYEQNFGHNLMNLEAMIREMNGRIDSDNVKVYNTDDEKKVLMAMLNARKYFKNALEAIPEIKKYYKALKEAESGLPIENNETPLLTAKPINTDNE